MFSDSWAFYRSLALPQQGMQTLLFPRFRKRVDSAISPHALEYRG